MRSLVSLPCVCYIVSCMYVPLLSRTVWFGHPKNRPRAAHMTCFISNYYTCLLDTCLILCRRLVASPGVTCGLRVEIFRPNLQSVSQAVWGVAVAPGPSFCGWSPCGIPANTNMCLARRSSKSPFDRSVE